jgi:hypothetical protein
MATIKKFGKENLQLMRQEIKDALLKITQKYDLELEEGINFRYDETELSAKIIFKTKDSINKDYKLLGLSESPIGKIFKQGNKTFTVCGIALSRRRYPIIGQDVNGKKFCFMLNVIK